MDGSIFPLQKKKPRKGIATWLVEGGAIPNSPELEAELVAPTYSFDTQGRIKVEPKEAIKKRLGRSPDLADALALSLAGQVLGAPDYDPIRVRSRRV